MMGGQNKKYMRLYTEERIFNPQIRTEASVQGHEEFHN